MVQIIYLIGLMLLGVLAMLVFVEMNISYIDEELNKVRKEK